MIILSVDGLSWRLGHEFSKCEMLPQEKQLKKRGS